MDLNPTSPGGQGDTSDAMPWGSDGGVSGVRPLICWIQGMRYAIPPVRSWPPGCFLCTTSSTLRELPVAGVNLLSAQDARIEIGDGGAQIRGSGRPGLAAQPQSRRCSECCDSIHPPAGHIYQCVPSLERAEYEIAMCWQLGERRYYLGPKGRL